MTRMSDAARLCLLLALVPYGLVASPAKAANQITLDVHLAPERIGLGETATFSIEARTGLARVDLRPSFGLENLEIVAGPSRVEEMTLENGLFSRTVRLIWRVRPLGLGPARVSAIRIGMGGRMVGIPPQTIQVQQEPTGGEPLPDPNDSPSGEDDPFDRLLGSMMPWRRPVAPPANNEAPLAFLRSEVSTDRPFVNQQVVYTIYLYSRVELAGVNPVTTPELRGFWAREVPLPDRLPTEIVTLGDLRYGRVPLLSRVLFPLRAGPHLLEPVRFQVATTQVERSFFSPPFAHPVTAELASPPVQVDVRPLPEGPAGYQGVVGPLAVAASLEPKILRVGEAATLKVRWSGNGNLEGVAAPTLSLPEGLRAFPPRDSGSGRQARSNLKSERTWAYLILADRPGVYSVAPPEVTYFDPASASFRRAEAKPLTLEARNPEPPSAAMARSGGPALREGSGFTLPGAPTAKSRPALLAGRRPLVWLGSIAAFLGLGSFFLWRMRSPLPEDEALRQFEEELAAARSEERPRRAAAAIESAWSHLLCARGLAETPTRASLEASAERLPTDLVASLSRVADDLHFLRSAPQLSNAEALRDEILGRSLRLAEELSRPRGHLLSSLLKQLGFRAARGSASRPWPRPPQLAIHAGPPGPSGLSRESARDPSAGSESARRGMP